VPQKIIRAKIKPIIVRAKIKLPRAQIAMPIIVRARIQTAPNAAA